MSAVSAVSASGIRALPQRKALQSSQPFGAKRDAWHRSGQQPIGLPHGLQAPCLHVASNT